MISQRGSDLIECLKESEYYRTFSKKSNNGDTFILVPIEFVLKNNELEDIDTFEKFFDILIKLDFWGINNKRYPKEIYYWIFINITRKKISEENNKELLNGVLSDTDIVKQIKIILDTLHMNMYIFTLTNKTITILEWNSYQYCAYLACEFAKKDGYEIHCDYESILHGHLDCLESRPIIYGWEYFPSEREPFLINSFEDITVYLREINKNMECEEVKEIPRPKIKSYKSDMRKIKHAEFKRVRGKPVQSKRNFGKHSR
jgi:hypothetical protein